MNNFVIRYKLTHYRYPAGANYTVEKKYVFPHEYEVCFRYQDMDKETADRLSQTNGYRVEEWLKQVD